MGDTGDVARIFRNLAERGAREKRPLEEDAALAILVGMTRQTNDEE